VILTLVEKTVDGAAVDTSLEALTFARPKNRTSAVEHGSGRSRHASTRRGAIRLGPSSRGTRGDA